MILLTASFSAVHPRSDMQLLTALMSCYTQRSAIPVQLRPVGLRMDPAEFTCQRWGLEGSHFLPVGFRGFAPAASSWTVCGQPDDPLADTYMTLWSESFGASLTDPASNKQAAWDWDAIKMSCSPLSLSVARRLRFWQPLLLTQVTSSMPYPSLPAGCVWTMSQFE